MKQIVMAITGASGAPYARRLAECIVECDAHLHLIISPYGRQLLNDELGLRDVSVAGLIGRTASNATLYGYHDVGAKIASGSFLTDGMVICPCSSNSLAAVANGLGDNLIARAATVTLKEARRLIIVAREMPLSRIEIHNMLRLSEAGAILCPASPGFYLLPKSVADLVDFVVGKVLDLLGLPHTLHTRWEPDRPAAASPAVPRRGSE
ncbi:MAG: UbiX family flavin prenyltransferase [Planctomycetes bacterium]|nr:UbiX family flavin prenyltransferase [Planctomycetota bacterium]